LLLGAQVYLVDAAHSLVFEGKLAEPAVQFASARLESGYACQNCCPDRFFTFIL
jgi:hypothetical protein